VAQLGARFHGMEEVVSSNLTRSTKTFQTVTVPQPAENVVAGVQLESKPTFSAWAANGHRVHFDAAHDYAFTVNVIQGMGIVGTVFQACCLLETTKTFASL
jgi:hydroxyacyl-ACP dehydratase HTD2-like protein with hotdog domain